MLVTTSYGGHVSSLDCDILFDLLDESGQGQLAFLDVLAAITDPRTVDVRELTEVCDVIVVELRSN